jgi:transcriptional regulator with XRE-family HTH domain
VNSQSFARRLAVARARLGLTPDDLAGRVGLAGGAIVAAFEDGTAIPTPAVLVRLADELGWSGAEVAPLLRESRRGLNRANPGAS